MALSQGIKKQIESTKKKTQKIALQNKEYATVNDITKRSVGTSYLSDLMSDNNKQNKIPKRTVMSSALSDSVSKTGQKVRSEVKSYYTDTAKAARYTTPETRESYRRAVNSIDNDTSLTAYDRDTKKRQAAELATQAGYENLKKTYLRKMTDETLPYKERLAAYDAFKAAERNELQFKIKSTDREIKRLGKEYLAQNEYISPLLGGGKKENTNGYTEIQTGNKYFDSLMNGEYFKNPYGQLKRSEMQYDYIYRQIKPLLDFDNELEQAYKNDPSEVEKLQKKLYTDKDFNKKIQDSYAAYLKFQPMFETLGSNLENASKNAQEQYLKDELGMLGTDLGQLNLYTNKIKQEMSPEDNGNYNLTKSRQVIEAISKGASLAKQGEGDPFDTLWQKVNMPDRNGLYGDRELSRALESITDEEKNIYYYTLGMYGREQADDYFNKLIGTRYSAELAKQAETVKKGTIPVLRFAERLLVRPAATMEGIGAAVKDIPNTITTFFENADKNWQSRLYQQNTDNKDALQPDTVGKYLLGGEGEYLPKLLDMSISNPEYSIKNVDEIMQKTEFEPKKRFYLNEYQKLLTEAMLDNKSEFGKILTNLAITVGDMGEDILIGKALTPAAGAASIEQLTDITSKLTRSVMGANVFSNSYVEAIDKGVSADRAFFGSLLKAVVSYKLEDNAISNILESKYSTNLLKQLFKSSLAEGGEEWAEDEIDNLVELFAYGSKSQWNEIYEANRAKGLSDKDATVQANLETFVYKPLESFGMGFAAGGIMSGFNAANGRLARGAEALDSGTYQYAIDALRNTNIAGEKVERLKSYILQYNEKLKNSRFNKVKAWYAGKSIDTLDRLKDTKKLIISQSAANDTELTPDKRELLARVAEKTDSDVVIAKLNNPLKGYKAGDDYIRGMWYSNGNTLFIDPSATEQDIERAISVHEMTHAAESSKHYAEYADYVKERLGQEEFNRRTAEIMKDDKLSQKDAEKEVIAYYTQKELFQNADEMKRFIEHNYSIANRVIDSLKDGYDKVKALFGKEASDNGLRYFERALGTRQPGVDTGTRNAIIKLPDGKQYVQADRQIMKSDNPDNWGNELEEYINDEIRHGRDVIIPTVEGDKIKITEDTAWKIGDLSEWDETTAPIKMNMGSHIDELLQVSKYDNNKDAGDRTGKRFQPDSFDYRIAFFRDFDEAYYKLNISIGVDKNGKTAYSIGRDIQKRSFPDINGSSVQNGRRSTVGAPYAYSTTNNNGSQDFSEKTDMQLALEKAGITENTFTDGEFSKESLSAEEARRINQINSDNFKEWFGDWQNDPEHASKVVNEDGTPKVVYHGTDKKFTIFKEGEKNGWLGKGIYFSDNKEYAKENGKYVMACYLDVKKPFLVEGNSPSDVFPEIKDRFPQADEYNLADILKQNGYDGIIYKHWDDEVGTMISVFDRNQIKSATDNIGTFDRNNPDIRYSKDTLTEEEAEKLNKYTVVSPDNTRRQWRANPGSWTGGEGESAGITLTPHDVIETLKNHFNLPISTGKVIGRNALGEYHILPETVRTRITNSLPTIAHELGHYLDRTYNINSFSSAATSEIMNSANPAFLNQYPAGQRRAEAVAEAIREYYRDMKAAREAMPTFFDELETMLAKKDMQVLNKTAAAFNEYLKSSADIRAKSYFRKFGEKRRNIAGIKGNIQKIRDNIIEYFVDRFNPVQKLTKAAEKKSGNKLSAGKNPYTMIMNSLNADGTIMYIVKNNMVAMDGEKVGDGLFKILEKVKGEKREDFDDYLRYKHAIEWLTPDENGNVKRVFPDDYINNVETVTRLANELEQKNPEFKNLSEQIYKYQSQLLWEYGVKSGLISEAQFRDLQKKYPHYVPFYRDIGDDGYPAGSVKRGYGDLGNGIKSAKGSGADITSPIEGIIRNTAQWVTLAKKNQVMKIVYDTVTRNRGLGMFAEEVPPDQAVHLIDTRPIIDRTIEAVNDTGLNLDRDTLSALTDIITGQIGDTALSIENVSKARRGDIVGLMVDGERKFLKFNDKALLRSLSAMNAQNLNAVMKFWTGFSNVFKQLTTSGSVFFTFGSNFERDFGTAFKSSQVKTPWAFAVKYGKAILDQITNDEDFQKYLAMGGRWETNVVQNRNAMARLFRDLKRSDYNKFVKVINGLTLGLYDNIQTISDLVETIPRYLEFKETLKNTGDIQQAIYDSGEVTTNFKRGGRWAKGFEPFVPYSNAAIQGTYHLANTLKTHPARTLTKMMTGAVLMSMLKYAFQKWFFDDGEDKDLSQYQKNNFHNFYIGNGKYFSLPKSQNFAILDTYADKLIEYWADKNESAFNDVVSYTLDQLLPYDYLSTVAGDVESGKTVGQGAWHGIENFAKNALLFGTVVDIMMNEDFKGSKIVPSRLEGLKPELQYDENTTWLAKTLGQALGGLSPMMIDHAINSNLGWVGKINSSVGAQNKDYTFGFANKFIKDAAYSNDTVNKFYDKKNEIDVEYKSEKSEHGQAKGTTAYEHSYYNSVGSLLSNLYKMAKDTKDEDEKKKIRREINNVSKNVEFKTGNKNVDTELERLFDKTGEGTFPFSIPDIKVDELGYTKTLSAPEYVDLYGKITQETVKAYDDIMKTDIYKAMSDKEKVNALNNIKDVIKHREEIKSFSGKESFLDALTGTNKSDVYVAVNGASADAAYYKKLAEFHPDNTEYRTDAIKNEELKTLYSYMREKDILDSKTVSELYKVITENTKMQQDKEMYNAIMENCAAAGSFAPLTINYSSIFGYTENGRKYEIPIGKDDLLQLVKWVNEDLAKAYKSIGDDGYRNKKGKLNKVKTEDGKEHSAYWNYMNPAQRNNALKEYKKRVFAKYREALTKTYKPVPSKLNWETDEDFEEFMERDE